jgi:hypothetical protein
MFNPNDRFIIMNNFITMALNPFEDLCNRRFGHLTKSEILEKIKVIQAKGDEKTCRDITILTYLKNRLI